MEHFKWYVFCSWFLNVNIDIFVSLFSNYAVNLTFWNIFDYKMYKILQVENFVTYPKISWKVYIFKGCEVFSKFKLLAKIGESPEDNIIDFCP